MNSRSQTGVLASSYVHFDGSLFSDTPMEIQIPACAGMTGMGAGMTGGRSDPMDSGFRRNEGSGFTTVGYIPGFSFPPARE